ncbi:helix-turn-helix transcriptional regulator [Corynebacterium epidermidicanis]|uniref:Putative transcriptional regulator n=1 Tax=Corynebacterium epidermidicanis TaxID=1050174 RepID=A0A0G3GRF4_9CORY|nr:WYL domain-containing protein [Corynebacterium epidermidicanis]AKK03135.1 putative transcriptional regulator [Corynebacterium epidermidicanis]
MTEKDPRLERLMNLTFAFLNADRLGKKYLTGKWIHSNVDGYQNLGETAFKKLFARDRRDLLLVGVPIETIAEFRTPDGVVQPAHRLAADDYALPEINFTPAEATVLGLAGDMGMNQELAAFARSGWTKIAAAGAHRELGGAEFTTVGDIASITAIDLDRILRACSKGLAISFSYQAAADSETQTRHMDPWGLVPLRNRLYLVGFDLDRDEPRSFRINRISDITQSGTATHPKPPAEDLQALVTNSLRRGHQLIDATVAIQPGRARELTEVGTLVARDDIPGYDTYELANVDQGWLVRSAAAHAPFALVLAPQTAREAVIGHLRAVAEAHKDACEEQATANTEEKS